MASTNFQLFLYKIQRTNEKAFRERNKKIEKRSNSDVKSTGAFDQFFRNFKNKRKRNQNNGLLSHAVEYQWLDTPVFYNDDC